MSHNNLPDDFYIDETEYTHPIAEFLDIHDIQPSETATPVECTKYDEKDSEIDCELSDLAKLAADTFKEQRVLALQVEPKFRGEVLSAANQMLATAISAVREKRELKKHKDKISSRGDINIKNGTTNIIVANRNDLLKQRKQSKNVDPE